MPRGNRHFLSGHVWHFESGKRRAEIGTTRIFNCCAQLLTKPVPVVSTLRFVPVVQTVEELEDKRLGNSRMSKLAKRSQVAV
jgi:hypothetical protein